MVGWETSAAGAAGGAGSEAGVLVRDAAGLENGPGVAGARIEGSATAFAVVGIATRFAATGTPAIGGATIMPWPQPWPTQGRGKSSHVSQWAHPITPMSKSAPSEGWNDLRFMFCPFGAGSASQTDP